MAFRIREDSCGSEESHAALGGLGHGGSGLEGGLAGEGGELIWSMETGSTVTSFKTARSWISSLSSSSTSPMLSDLLPSIVLILPPCLCAGETSTIDIHIEHPVSIDARYDIVCMMRGLHITSTPVQPSDGLIIRMELPPLAVGVVDVFVHQTTTSPSSYAGAPGHLLVLPDASTRDANAMLATLVDLALTDPMSAGLPSTIPEVPEGGIHHSRSCNSLTSNDRPLRDLATTDSDFNRRSQEDIPEPSPFAVAGQGQNGPYALPSMTISLPQPLRTSPNIAAPTRALEVEKWVWIEHFIPFVLEVEAILRAVSRSPYTRSEITSSSQNSALQIGPTFVQVLENMLLHLKKFGSWEFIAFLLRRSIQAGISVFWDTLLLEGHNLTGQRLKELSRNPANGGGLNCHLNDSIEPDTPQPQESLAIPQRSDLMGMSAPILVRDDSRRKRPMNRMKKWMSMHTFNRKEEVEPSDSQRERGKWKGRIRTVIKQISQSMRREGNYRESLRVPVHSAGPSDTTLPTIESGMLLVEVSRRDSASERQGASVNRETKRRGAKGWLSLRRRFFKTDSANTEDGVQQEHSNDAPTERRRMGRLRRLISSMHRGERSVEEARERAINAV